MHAVVAVVKLQSPPGGGFGAPGASTTEYHTQAHLYESKLCAEIEDISYFETIQTVVIS
jgi:hypothetical protein